MYKCPKCGSAALNVVTDVSCRLVQGEGGQFETEETGGHEWGSDSPMSCDDCGECGTAGEFVVPTQPKRVFVTVCLSYGGPVALDDVVALAESAFEHCRQEGMLDACNADGDDVDCDFLSVTLDAEQ